MHAAVQRHARDADIVVMAAAVADYTPAAPRAGKIEKTDAPLELSLVRTPDILADARPRHARGRRSRSWSGSRRRAAIRSSAAVRSCVRKGADLIVANDISPEGSGFDSELNAASIISRDGVEAFPLGPKSALAALILDRAEARLAPLTT